MAEYYNTKKETMPRNKLRELQINRLREQSIYAYNNTGYYKELFNNHGFDPHDIDSISDFRRNIPLVDKDNFRKTLNNTKYSSFLACEPEEIIYLTLSSGTTGIPTPQALTQTELEFVEEQIARKLYGRGLRERDLSLIYGTFGHQYFEWSKRGHRQIGATLYKRDMFAQLETDIGGNVEEVITKYEVNALGLLLMHLLKLTDLIKESNLKVHEVYPDLKFIQAWGDTIAPTLREYLEEFWRVPIYDSAGPTETLNAIYMVCQQGHQQEEYHCWEDLCYTEAIDPQTKQLLDPGERGILIQTPLYNEAFPFLRWNTEDGVEYRGEDPCPCGRTHKRFKILGRIGESVSANGELIFIKDVEEIVYQHRELIPNPVQLVKVDDSQAKLKFRTCFDGDDTDRRYYMEQIEDEAESRFQVSADFKFVPRKQLLGDVPYKYNKYTVEG